MHVEGESVIRRLMNEFPAVYVLFDILWLDGHSTMDLPYTERRELLTGLQLTGASWQTPPHEVGDGTATIDVSKQFELEGVVAKRVDSRYEVGRRSTSWVKVKNQLRQEFVVGGWQPGEGGRTGSIGSLLIGYYDGDVLHYAGKVGSGLSQAEIARTRSSVRTGARVPTVPSAPAASRRVCTSSSPTSSSTCASPSGRAAAVSGTRSTWARVTTRTRATSCGSCRFRRDARAPRRRRRRGTRLRGLCARYRSATRASASAHPHAPARRAA